jgi:hypothetical protein
METTGREDRNMAAETRGTPGANNASPGTNDTMSALLETLELSPFRKDLLRQRWLDQVLWSSRQARRMRFRHYGLRLPIVIGGVAVPGLISLSLSTAPGATGDLRQVTFLVSLMVAILAALEGVFQFGERWRHYRRTAERLKSAGWQFLMLNGPYRRYPTHELAFVPFTERVEEILGEDVEGYLGQLATEGPDKGGGIVN